MKIKVRQDEDLLVCGFQSDEDGIPKDLILGYFDEKGDLKRRNYEKINKNSCSVVFLAIDKEGGLWYNKKATYYRY